MKRDARAREREMLFIQWVMRVRERLLHVSIELAYVHQVCRWVLLRMHRSFSISWERGTLRTRSNVLGETLRELRKQDRLLLFRLTSRLDGNDESIVVLVRAHFKRLLMANEEKQTTMPDRGKNVVFVRTNWISWINTWRQKRIDSCVCVRMTYRAVFGAIKWAGERRYFICSFFSVRCLLPSSMGRDRSSTSRQS